MASAFRGALDFFYELGIYDVVLPFLLVFTIVFAILEKTKIFGTVDVEGTEYTKKNLNAMMAFVTAFFVVASTRLVAIINEVVASVALLLLMSVLFLLLAGSFNKDEEFYLKKGWNTAFMVIMFVGLVLVFLHALGWLQFIYTYVSLYWTTTTVSSILLIIIVLVVMGYIVRSPKPAKKEES